MLTEANRTLEISYTNLTSTIELPLGNHLIDELVDVLNHLFVNLFKKVRSMVQLESIEN